MKRKRLSLTDLLIAIAVIAFVIGILLAALNPARHTAFRLTCKTNLKNVGSAMNFYARESYDYRSSPVAGGPGTVWSQKGIIHRWHNSSLEEAFGITATTPGEATITSSLYLLVKYTRIKPKSFVCKGDGATEFRLWEQHRVRTHGGRWDFGDGTNDGRIFPGGYCSYAYHMPYSKNFSDVTRFPIVDQTDPAAPVCADRNPHLDRNAVNPKVSANSAAHRGKGQNVLFKDGSVRFETTSTCGLRDDNIYTYAADPNIGGDPAGTPPTGPGMGFPASQKDAYLVSERNRTGPHANQGAPISAERCRRPLPSAGGN